MFKKTDKHTFESERQHNVRPFQDLASRPPNPFTSDLMNAIVSSPEEPVEEMQENEEPETIIAKGVSIAGTISFQRLLRIDGNFEGELLSSGKLIVGPTGSVKANLNLEEAFISGKVTGNITVKVRVVLRGRAEIQGDITAPLLSVDEGVSILGILNIAQTRSQDADPFDHDHYFSDN